MTLLARSELSSDPKLSKAVREANADWVEAMKTGDAAIIVAPYADDAVFVMIDGTTIQGRTAIEKLYHTRFEQSGGVALATINSKDLVVDGDIAYEWGYGEVGVVRGDRLTKAGSRYLTVWQRQVDGEWRIIRNIVLP